MKKLVQVVCIATVALWLLPITANAEGLTQQDYIEIQQLYARYNHAIDSGDAEGWADTFTADGVFAGRFKGRDALIGFVKLWRERMNGAQRRHWNSNLTIAGDGKTATGSVYLMLLDIGQKPVAVASTGTYADALVKTANGWRFTSRVVNNDPSPAAPPPAK